VTGVQTCALPISEPSLLHEYLHIRLLAIVRTRAGQRDAIAASHGEATGSSLRHSGEL
jgi:hypothetical protein